MQLYEVFMNKKIPTKDISILIEELISYSVDYLSLKNEDIHYVRNQLLDLFKVNEPAKSVEEYGYLQDDILNPMIEYAIKSKLIKKIDSLLFETKIMGIVTPCPSQVVEEFDIIASNQGIEEACSYFYSLSCNSNYIRRTDINKNIEWIHNGEDGDIKITINLAKPEKDIKEILEATKTPKMTYPKCMLCPSNVGFSGNYNYPPRQTLRTIPIFLNEEYWHMQYSPYSYFQEHLIALSDEHRPMIVDNKAIIRMMDYVDIFPQYFIGSNAALPIVGGSILAHDHYQGGAKVMPMMSAKVKNNYHHNYFNDITLSTLNWYNSVLRIAGSIREEVIRASAYILESWSDYSDKDVDIIAKSDKEQHNAITPIVRLEEDIYVVDMILRNNRTDKEHPHGIFHPTEDLHNIKKESIGIIEVMGLFILPGRLYGEKEAIKEYLTGKKKLDFELLAQEDNPLNKHLSMIAQLTNDYGIALREEEAEEAVKNYINYACEKILKCTAVFKDNALGRKAFEDFIISTGFER